MTLIAQASGSVSSSSVRQSGRAAAKAEARVTEPQDQVVLSEQARGISKQEATTTRSASRGGVTLRETRQSERVSVSDRRASAEADVAPPGSPPRPEHVDVDVSARRGESSKDSVLREVELPGDVTVYHKSESSRSVNAEARSRDKLEVERGDRARMETDNKAEVVGEAKETSTTGIRVAGVNAESESEKKVAVDLHVNATTENVMNKDEFTAGLDVDVAAEGTVAEKDTYRLKSDRHDLVEVYGESSTGVGPSGKGGLGFSRKNGEKTTEFRIHAGGPILPFVGAGGGVKVRVADETVKDVVKTGTMILSPALYALGLGDKSADAAVAALNYLPKLMTTPNPKFDNPLLASVGPGSLLGQA